MRYLWVTGDCIEAGPCCTAQLREELSKLSFQTLHSVREIFEGTDYFWLSFSMAIIEMLDKQVSRDYLIAVNQLPTDDRISKSNSLITFLNFRLSAFEQCLSRIKN